MTGHERLRRFRARSCVRGFYRHVCHGVVRLAEISRAMPMGADEERLAVGLSRIFGGHLGLNREGVRDTLAGLPDRRAFGARFRELISPKLGRETSPFGPLRAGEETRGAQLAMIERDSVKRVNDGFGHPGGDEALARLARLLDENFRETDRLFHFGGETFVAVLPDTDSQGAAAALERLRALVENFDFPRAGRLTVSIGYTAARRDDTGASASARAEEALYAAKEQGRNRLCCFETLPARGAVAAG